MTTPEPTALSVILGNAKDPAASYDAPMKSQEAPGR